MVKICPKCKKAYSDYLAISRKDNKTKICPSCGIAEAFEDYYNYIVKKRKG